LLISVVEAPYIFHWVVEMWPGGAPHEKAGLDRVAAMRAIVTQQQLQPPLFRRGVPRRRARCVAVRLAPARGLWPPGQQLRRPPGQQMLRLRARYRSGICSRRLRRLHRIFSSATLLTGRATSPGRLHRRAPRLRACVNRLEQVRAGPTVIWRQRSFPETVSHTIF
jgi:hypothetical protein